MTLSDIRQSNSGAYSFLIFLGANAENNKITRPTTTIVIIQRVVVETTVPDDVSCDDASPTLMVIISILFVSSLSII